MRTLLTEAEVAVKLQIMVTYFHMIKSVPAQTELDELFQAVTTRPEVQGATND